MHDAVTWKWPGEGRVTLRIISGYPARIVRCLRICLLPFIADAVNLTNCPGALTLTVPVIGLIEAMLESELLQMILLSENEGSVDKEKVSPGKTRPSGPEMDVPMCDRHQSIIPSVEFA